MADQIERRADYSVKHPDWTGGLTEADRPTPVINQEGRGRHRLSLPAVISIGTAILVGIGFAKNLSGSDRGHLVAQAFSETPRTKVTVGGVMLSQRPGFLNYRSPADCNEYPTKSGKQGCWGRHF